MREKIAFVAFDADDTLWENELYFQEFEQKFCLLLSRYLPATSVSEELFKTEMKNLHIYGYGVKSILLSMIETYSRITGGTGEMRGVDEIIRLGQELLQKPVCLLNGVKEVIMQLHGRYKLVLATKGDLCDQQRKVIDSGLQEYFQHIEIMSEKKEADYRRLFDTLGCQPQELLMIGNSMKSDILPVLALGGFTAHVPHHVTWAHEHYNGVVTHPNHLELQSIKEIVSKLT